MEDKESNLDNNLEERNLHSEEKNRQHLLRFEAPWRGA
jgi:hypothetical protein